MSSPRPKRSHQFYPGETYKGQIKRLSDYLMQRYLDQIHDGGAVDNAIRILEEHRLDVIQRLGKLVESDDA